jgi:hypothetical protein
MGKHKKKKERSMKTHFSLVLVFALILALVGCSSSSSSGSGGTIPPGTGDPSDPGGSSCPDPWVMVTIIAPDSNTEEIPVGEYTFMAEISTTYPNRTDVVWTINGVEYTDADFAGGVSQVTVTFDAEIDEMEISVTATCTATDLRTDTDTDSRTIRVGDTTSLDPVALLSVRTACSSNSGSFFAITPSPDYHLYAWGKNDKGQLGLGDTVDREEPVRIPGQWYSVAAHNDTIYAVSSNGNLFVWGEHYTSEPTDLGRDTDSNPWQGITAGDYAVIATNYYNESYLWSDNDGIFYDDRILITKTNRPDGVSLFCPKVSVGSNYGYTIFKDSAGNLLIIDLLSEEYVPLELGWGAESYDISLNEAAFIIDGKLYYISDVEGAVDDRLSGVYDDPSTPRTYMTQIGTDTDWLRVYSAYDGIVAIKESSPNNEIHFFGDLYPSSVYQGSTPPGTAVIEDLVDYTNRTVQWEDRLMYLPNAARFSTLF